MSLAKCVNAMPKITFEKKKRYLTRFLTHFIYSSKKSWQQKVKFQCSHFLFFLDLLSNCELTWTAPYFKAKGVQHKRILRTFQSSHSCSLQPFIPMHFLKCILFEWFFAPLISKWGHEIFRAGLCFFSLAFTPLFISFKWEKNTRKSEQRF